jgi:hypothetical protein
MSRVTVSISLLFNYIAEKINFFNAELSKIKCPRNASPALMRIEYCRERTGAIPAMLDVRRLLIVAGAVLLAAGLSWPWLSRIGLGRLPGDIVVGRPGFQFYFPVATCLAISVVLTLLFWMLRK